MGKLSGIILLGFFLGGVVMVQAASSDSMDKPVYDSPQAVHPL